MPGYPGRPGRMGRAAIPAAMGRFCDFDINGPYTTFDGHEEMEELEESAWFQEDDKLRPGTYSLTEDICSPVTGEIIALEKSKVKIEEYLEPIDRLFNQNIYKVNHPLTNQEL